MKKSLAHLPTHKRHELSLITKIICEKFPDAQMIILFGSYARGDWVEDIYTEGHITYEYKSDFDILAITRSKKHANNTALQEKIENYIYHNGQIKTDVHIIYHHLKQVNVRLSEGQYFFSDIKKEGILLYDSKRFKLGRRRPLDPLERKKIAEEDFKQWFKSAREFYDSFKTNFDSRRYKLATFELHQATERFYVATLLVFTGYRPKLHDISKLGRLVAACHPGFLTVFPRATAEQKRVFKLLKKAYIDARYKASYKIKKAELKYLAERVQKLQKLTKQICKKKINSFV